MKAFIRNWLEIDQRADIAEKAVQVGWNELRLEIRQVFREMLDTPEDLEGGFDFASSLHTFDTPLGEFIRRAAERAVNEKVEELELQKKIDIQNSAFIDCVVAALNNKQLKGK